MSCYHLHINTPLQRGKYIIEKVLNEEKFCITYLANLSIFSSKIVIKEFFAADLCERDNDSKRMKVSSPKDVDLVNKHLKCFERNARILARLRHSNIITVSDIFEENDTAYYVMEYIDGEPLSDLIGRTGPLPENIALTYIEKISEVLIYLHERNILHLNLKPSNLLLRKNGEIVVSDIGWASQVYPGYSPLELYRFDIEKCSPASDIFSLGAISYKLLSGMTPPPAEDLSEEGSLRPSNVNPQIWNVIEKAMNPRVKYRLQNIDEFLSIIKNRCSDNIECSPSATNKPDCASKPNGAIIHSMPSSTPHSEESNLTYLPKTNKRKNLWLRIFGKKEKQLQDVYSSVFAPSEVKPKSRIMVQVYLHLNEETEKVKALATESDKSAERRDYIPLQTKLKKGDKVDVVLNINGNTLLYNSRKSIIWQGSFCKCAFDYLVPSDLDVDELSCSVTLYVNGAIVGEMLFYTQIVDSPTQLNANVIARQAKKLFISYSHNDLKSAEKIAKLYEGMDVDVFFDKHRLKSGYIYSDEIFNFIRTADTFVLCWSENAAQSEYVEKERKAALELAYPNRKPREDAQIRIKPFNIQPYATPPKDMIEHYHFEEL